MNQKAAGEINNSKDKKLSASKVILFVSVPLMILMILSEFLLNVVNPEQLLIKVDDPDTVYQFYPEREGNIQTEEFRANVHTNDLQMRDCPLISPKADSLKNPASTDAEFGSWNSEIREKQVLSDRKKNKHNNIGAKLHMFRSLLMMGDSFAEGWGNDCSAVYAELMRNYVTGSVYNAGIHGGSPPSYVLLARRFTKAVKPDAVVIQIFDNDLFDSPLFYQFLNTNEDQTRIISAKPPSLGFIPGGYFTRMIRELNWYRLTKRVYQRIGGQIQPIKYYKVNRTPDIKLITHEEAIEKYGAIKSISDPDREYGGQFGFYKFTHLVDLENDRKWQTPVKLFKSSLSQLVSEIYNYQNETIGEAKASDKPKIYILYIPAKEVFAPQGVLKSGADGIKVNPMFDLIRETVKGTDVKIIDSRPFLGKDPNRYYFPHDAHLNADGHRVIAEMLAKEMN
jgi:hypothetical protein